MANSNEARVVYHDRHDAKGFTNENTLANALLTKPDKLNPVLTHLMGREDKRFPLSFMTEGQRGGVKQIEINDVQYSWDTFKRLKTTDSIVSTTYSGTDSVGIGFSDFYVTFKTAWLKQQRTVESPNGTRARIMGKPIQNGAHYQYTLRLIGVDSQETVDISQLQAGVLWGTVGGASVSESYSKGNESNVTAPGKMKNQISFIRKSYEIGGNLSNKTVEVQFNINGKKTNYWIDFERWQHMIDWKQTCEEEYWYSKYNRDAQGVITLTDPDTNLPIPMGAGLLDQIPNEDTYGKLTADKIKRTVADVMYGATDTGNMDIVLYTGEGGAEEFDTAMKDEASGFSLVSNANVGDKFVTGSGRSLSYGAYFTQYQHVDGHTVTLKKVPLFDHGGRAAISPKHPVTGKPLESYRMVFLDQSIYDGERNVQMVTQKGRAMRTGVLQGMAKLPGIDFKGNNGMNIATDQDKSSVHFMSAKGVGIRRNTHCFQLECEAGL